MAITPKTVEVVSNNGPAVMKAFEVLTSIDIMVGIPSSKGLRDEGPITNAQLGYIHEFGAPGANIPARPFLRPGIENAQPLITARLLSAAKAALAGEATIMLAQLEAAGMGAVNAIKSKITDGPFAPLAQSTLAARRRKLRGKKLTAAERKQGFATIRPLIDTGQLRRSITYVLRNRQGQNIGGKP